MKNKESVEQLYTKLYNENINELKKMKSEYENYQKKQDTRNVKETYALLLMIIIGIVLYYYSTEFGGSIFNFFILITLIGIIVYISKPNKVNKKLPTHNDMFKEKVIFPVVQYIIPECEYAHIVGLSKDEYDEGKWETYTRYKSEDRLVVSINIGEDKKIKTNLVISEICTVGMVPSLVIGGFREGTQFNGLASYAKLPKDIGFSIRVSSYSLSLDTNYTPEKDIEVDMTQFEEKFCVETDDRIKTMQILTPDIMSKIIDIAKTSKVKFDFCINHDMIHVRFHTGPMFEFDLFKETDQYEKIKYYCNIVSNVKEITEQICNIVLNVEL